MLSICSLLWKRKRDGDGHRAKKASLPLEAGSGSVFWVLRTPSRPIQTDGLASQVVVGCRSVQRLCSSVYLVLVPQSSGRKSTIEVQICQIAIGKRWLRSGRVGGKGSSKRSRASSGRGHSARVKCRREGKTEPEGRKARFDKGSKVWYKSATRERGNGS
jgi:hypothetical protein